MSIPAGITVVRRPKHRRTIAVELTPRKPRCAAINRVRRRIACTHGLRARAGATVVGCAVEFVKQVIGRITLLKAETAENLAVTVRPYWYPE